MPKEDLGTSAAELVYGEPLTVPGEFLNPNAKPLSCHSDPFNSLIKRLVPTPTSQHGLSTPTTPHCLENVSFVFIRRDCHRGPLQRPYDGPYRVITPGPKTFRVKVGLREEVISVDRLKPAHVDLTQPVSVAQPRQRGRPPTQAKQEKPMIVRHQYVPVQLEQQTSRSGRRPSRFQ